MYYINAEDSWDGIPSFYSIGIDVTKDREEQMRQHQALEDAYQAARIANNAKSNFLSAMSHDIRTPMNAIMGMSSIAQAIRALDRDDAKRIPILALSANTFTSDLGKTFSVGMNDHIAKPIDIQLLIEVLKKWM